jgi:hypothetical protein
MKNAKLIKLGEFDREKSDILLERRTPLPKKQDRPISKPKLEVNMKDLEELVETSLEAIKEVANGESEGKVCFITTDKIVIDPRARWKCIITRYSGYYRR